ncbi:hypothetical protein RCO28_25430 [Streptomyces sp. LHD-70]|uniref:hypothetical protein n=1 Tax=Streptomyces sp. LHD-70 TaxID=3072140 RepID=UPI0028109559|nr:hypothetical protein [Streptomyces sp. LHD-70]MDQ8705813.1 hypothetical protein [Streptomyces sp. LHD-70]
MSTTAPAASRTENRHYARVVRGATAVFGGHRSLRPSPYLVFGTLFWVLVSAAAWRVPICCDFGQHAAVVERLKADLLNPAHPTVALPGDGSAYYSPYAVIQGAFAQLTGLAGWQVVKLTGAVNLIVLLTGLNRAVKTLTTRAWAPVLALAFMVLLWGTRMAWWSGYLGLMSLTGHLPFPSTFGIGLTFWAWALTARLARSGGSPRAYAGLGALCGLVLLVHPISAVAAMTGVLAFVVGRQRDWHARVVGCWALAGAVAILVALVWPYYSVFSLVGDQSVHGIHEQLYSEMEARFWLALIGVPVLWLRRRRDRLDPLVLMFAAEVLVIAYGWFSGHYTYGRILGLTLVPLQFALAVELAEPRPWPVSRRFLAQAAAVGTALGFLVHGGAVVPRSVDPIGFDQPPRWPQYAWAARRIAPGEVVLTDGYRASRSLPGYGPNLVAPAWPDASLPEPERTRRQDAVHRYLADDSTPAERAAIVHEYDVRWLLLSPDQKAPREAVVVAWGPETGEVLARVPGDPGRGKSSPARGKTSPAGA